MVTAEFKRKWAELQKILVRQREKGGVIDPEAESNRFLIHINHVSILIELHTLVPFLSTASIILQANISFRFKLSITRKHLL